LGGAVRRANLGISRVPLAIADKKWTNLVEFGVRVLRSETQASIPGLGRFFGWILAILSPLPIFLAICRPEAKPRRFFEVVADFFSGRLINSGCLQIF
jgi:hypothetical protein